MVNSYLLLKLIHILSATVIAGTGTGIAFFMLMAYRSRDIHAIRVTARLVVLADWLFTTPAVMTQLLTGLALMEVMGIRYTSPWFYGVAALFVFIGLCWLPVVAIQYRLRQLSSDAEVLPDGFHRLMRWWMALGIPAFAALLVLFWLMVFKPLPLA
ncbi:membrane protein [Pokkaliibacter plantistimulans]|uniref:Membrane protein n=2 Tax=Pokkaliibacter plantistimulans TaxID=1635171 RepID=A0ABX5LXR2_9GAMM|nr:membrane protein [Pokkaliibacter plantistimulans]